METVRLRRKPRCLTRWGNILPLLVFSNLFIWILWEPWKLRVFEGRDLFLSMLMTTLDISGSILFMISLTPCRFLNILPLCITWKGRIYWQNHLHAENLRTLFSCPSALLKGLLMSSLPLSHLSITKLLIGRTIHFNKLWELWFTANTYHYLFGLKQWILPIIFTIG